MALINTNTLSRIQENIGNTLKRINQKNKKITIIAVTKTHPFEAIESALENNIINIGENRVQETEQKIKDKKLPLKARLHFIGTLQRNKAKKAVSIYDYIQTLDSIRLAEKINSSAKNIQKQQNVFLQINIADQKEKKGFLTSEVIGASKKISQYSNILIKGVMIIPPITKNKNTYIGYFKKAQEIRNQIQKQIPECKNLSMGMSGDYIEAIKEGATHIRIGTALFGERKK